jgi:outer membrane protein OmpA-like peptidoglycan-associated protein
MKRTNLVAVSSGFLVATFAASSLAQPPPASTTPAAAPASAEPAPAPAAPAASPPPASNTAAGASGSVSFDSSAGASADGDASAHADDDTRFEPKPMQFELGLILGIMLPSKDHNIRADGARPEAYASVAPEFAMRASFLPIPYVGAEFEAAWLPTSTENDSTASLFAGRAHVIGQFPIGRFTPFALIGAGAIGGGSTPMGTDTDPALHFGLGLKYALTEGFGVRLDVRDTLSQKIGSATEDVQDGDLTSHWEVLLSATFALSARGEEQKCAPSPVDSDHDGFVDTVDKCPALPGVAPDGCPDKDSDGDTLLDSKDACPTEAGPPEKGGCPVRDTDKDGVPDEFDKCPNEPGPLNGCPDLDPDKDGVNAPDDRCPDKPETRNGYEDQDGCPDEIPEKIRKFTGVIKGIEFDTGKDTIRAVSEGVLNGALVVLQEYPKTRIEISGHTDDVGTRENNLDLSKRRAESVKNWFAGKGIDAKRIETRGAGPDEPIAENKGPDGRQKNRRIEFKLLQ